MIFTIGSADNYDKLLARDEPVFKMGRRPVGDKEYPGGYIGGIVFPGEEPAKEYIASMRREGQYGYEVYFVEGDWSPHYVYHPTGHHAYLLDDRQIICKLGGAMPESAIVLPVVRTAVNDIRAILKTILNGEYDPIHERYTQAFTSDWIDVLQNRYPREQDETS